MNISTLTGWRRRGVAALLGICAALALPPVFLLPLLIPAFAGLCVLVAAAPTHKQAFYDGWWWGLGYFTAGLYWICISLYVEPEKFAWLTPFALFGLPSVLAIYIGLTTLVWAMIPLSSARKLPLFALLWVGAEWLRAHLFTGFPWNLIGYTWTVSDITIQGASIVGVYGLSAIAVLIASVPALYSWRVRTWPAVTLALTILLVMVVYGEVRLEQHPTQYTSTHIRMVQGNISQQMKFDPKTEFAGLQTYMQLSQQRGAWQSDIIIWPETAVPYFFEEGSTLAHDLGAILPEHTVLLTGGIHGIKADGNWQVWNSVFAINHNGKLMAQYDKHHLVPFGEYIPLRGILPVEAIAGGHGDFSRGSGPQTLAVTNIPPFSPLICYEAVFPDEVVDKSGKAQWLLTVTNDAWFGTSSGPYQHLQMARMRAVEQGIPLVRVANTGISAVVDAYGRVVQRLPLNQAGILDGALPQKATDATLFSQFTYEIFLSIVVLCGLFLCVIRETK